METFYTVQGEGFYSGRAAFFIRVAGCDVGCVWCDVKDSWDANEHEVLQVSNLVNQVKESGTNFVVITGGEPGMYDLNYLTNELHKLDVEIAVETSADLLNRLMGAEVNSSSISAIVDDLSRKKMDKYYGN